MSFFFLHHPTEADLALFAGGEAGPLARWRIERHLDCCGSCRDVVADFFHLQSDLGELAEVPQLDWAAFARQIKAAAAQAEVPADDALPSDAAAGSWFGRSSAWGVGLASATAICGFVIFRQFSPDVMLTEKAALSMPLKQDASALLTEVAVGDRRADPSALPAEQAAAGFQFAGDADSLKADKKTVENLGRQNRQLAEDDAGTVSTAAVDAEKITTRALADSPAAAKQNRGFGGGTASFEETDLRADVVSATGNKRSAGAADLGADPRRKGRRIVGGILAAASEIGIEQDTDRHRVEEEIPSPVRLAAADELGAGSTLTKAKSREQHAEKAAFVETESEPALADVARQKQFALNAPPASAAPPRRESAEQPPELSAALEKNEAARALRDAGSELRRESARTASNSAAQDESSRRSRDAEFSLLPEGLRYEEAEIGVAADGSMSIRTLDSATHTVTITHVYLP